MTERYRINVHLPRDVYLYIKGKAKDCDSRPATWVKDVLIELARGGPRSLLPKPKAAP